MLDLIHASWRAQDPWSVAVDQPCRLSLALESEWGKKTSRVATTEEVFRDATKIAFVRATAKVMLFGSCDTGHRNEIVDLLNRLRRNTDDPSPWLWIDAPWWRDEHQLWIPAFGVLQ